MDINMIQNLYTRLDEMEKVAEHELNLMLSLKVNHRASFGCFQAVFNKPRFIIAKIRAALNCYMKNDGFSYDTKWISGNSPDVKNRLVSLENGKVEHDIGSDLNGWLHGYRIMAWMPTPDASYMDILFDGYRELRECKENQSIINQLDSFYQKSINIYFEMLSLLQETLDFLRRNDIFSSAGFWHYKMELKNIPDTDFLVSKINRNVVICHGKDEFIKNRIYISAWAYLPKPYVKTVNRKEDVIKDIAKLCMQYGITGDDINKAIDKEANLVGGNFKISIVGKDCINTFAYSAEKVLNGLKKVKNDSLSISKFLERCWADNTLHVHQNAKNQLGNIIMFGIYNENYIMDALAILEINNAGGRYIAYYDRKI